MRQWLVAMMLVAIAGTTRGQNVTVESLKAIDTSTSTGRKLKTLISGGDVDTSGVVRLHGPTARIGVGIDTPASVTAALTLPDDAAATAGVTFGATRVDGSRAKLYGDVLGFILGGYNGLVTTTSGAVDMRLKQSGKWWVYDSGNVARGSVDQTGNFWCDADATVDGDVTVGGEDIKDAAGNAPIILDGVGGAGVHPSNNVIFLMDDYVEGVIYPSTTAASGTGTGGDTNPAAIPPAFGIGQFYTGTTSTGSSASYLSRTGSLIFGSGVCETEWKVLFDNLSDGTDTYVARVGFHDSNAATAPTDGAYFRYTDSENSGQWVCVTRSNSTETSTATSIAVVASAFDKLKVAVDATGTTATFTIDNSVVATHASNVPTAAGREFGCAAVIAKTVGATQRKMRLDYGWIYIKPSTAR